MMKIVIILLTLISFSLALKSKTDFNPITFALNNDEAIVISCKKIVSSNCVELVVSTKLAEAITTHSNVLSLTSSLAGNLPVKFYAVDNVSSSKFVVTLVTSNFNQYTAIVASQNGVLSVDSTLPSIVAAGIKSVDVSNAIEGLILTAEFEDRNKVAFVNPTTFTVRNLPGPKIGPLTSLDYYNAFIVAIEASQTCGGDVFDRVHILSSVSEFCISGSAHQCYSSTNQVNFISSSKFLVGYTESNKAKLSTFDIFGFTEDKKKKDGAKKAKKDVPTRNWNSEDETTYECFSASYTPLSQLTFSGKGGRSISSTQVTFGKSYDNVLDVAVTTSQRGELDCKVATRFANVNQLTGALTRSYSQKFVTLDCTDQGQDRIYYDNDFFLFRYQSQPVEIEIPRLN